MLCTLLFSFVFMKKLWLQIILSLLLPSLIGALSWAITASAVTEWYMTLNKPSFNPPNWIFGPVWTLLYLMIGFAFFQVWQTTGLFSKIPLITKIIYWLQLALNFSWSIVFFWWESPWFWFVVIALLWISILANIVFFFQIKKSAWILLIPYLLWVSFASILNYYIFILN